MSYLKLDSLLREYEEKLEKSSESAEENSLFFNDIECFPNANYRDELLKQIKEWKQALENYFKYFANIKKEVINAKGNMEFVVEATMYCRIFGGYTQDALTKLAKVNQKTGEFVADNDSVLGCLMCAEQNLQAMKRDALMLTPKEDILDVRNHLNKLVEIASQLPENYTPENHTKHSSEDKKQFEDFKNWLNGLLNKINGWLRANLALNSSPVKVDIVALQKHSIRNGHGASLSSHETQGKMASGPDTGSPNFSVN